MINGKIIKICGMRKSENIQEVEAIAEVDLLGFIFYPKSPRYVCDLPAYLPTRARRVGVFVNEDEQAVRTQAEHFALDYVQLHGNESPDYCRSLRSTGLRIIKAFSVHLSEDLDKVRDYEDSCDFFLFDTPCEQYGGSGHSFDWTLLHTYNGPVPFLLSGGIHPHSANALKGFSHPRLAGYDLNSRFEILPGEKSAERIRTFLNELKTTL